jgi:hypothetical protein
MKAWAGRQARPIFIDGVQSPDMQSGTARILIFWRGLFGAER